MTSSDLLKGCYIGHVHNVVFSHPVRANQLDCDPVGTDGNFQFPASSEFTAAVNAYYHIDRFFGAIEGMGYPHAENIGTGNISVFVNEGLDTLGSTHSDFVSRELHFTRPYVSSNALIQRNAALAADVLYHEAQHFVTLGYGMSFGPLTPQVGTRGHENVALQEGLSDYMAAAFTGDPHINEYLVVRCSTVTAHGDSTAGRWLDSDRTVVNYTNYARVSGCDSGPGNPHAAGMILSGALWDLRKVIGAQADTLVIEALAYLPDQPDFACMKDAMYQVAFDHHGGANSFRILSAFTRRHIKGCTVEIAQNSDPVGETRTVLYNQPTTFRALDLCGRVPLSTATWSLADLCDPSCPEFVAIPDDDIYDDAVTIAVAGDKRLRMRAETIFGAVDEDVVELIVDPTIVLQGEGTLTRTRGVCCPIGSFTAVASGRPPIAYQWRLDHQICASCGTDSVMSRPFCVDATVTCRITDANGRSKQASIRVSLAGSCTAAGTVSLSIAEGGGRVVNGAIQFGVPGPGQIVEVQVVDVAGRVVARPWMGILQGEQEHRVVWDARTLRPGMYFYRIKAGEQRVAQKFALVR
jgi:hypothetical protein